MDKKQWTDTIPNNILCGYYYVFFIIFSVWAAVSVIGGVWIYARSNLSFGLLAIFMFQIILTFGLAATNALFLHLICERALKPAAQAQAQAQQGQHAPHALHNSNELM